MLPVFFTLVIFLSIQLFIPQKHAIEFKSGLKITHWWKQKLKDQNKIFEINAILWSTVNYERINSKNAIIFSLHALVFVNLE
jgi:hypothetical protein